MKTFWHPIAAIAFVVCALPNSAVANEYSLDDLSWLTGHWIDLRDPEKPIEVRWNGASDGAMIGTWRKNKNGALAFYEILTLREADGDIFYRFDFYKHNEGDEIFSSTAPTRLRLIEAGENHAIFRLISEENWILTMEVVDGVLRGWMEDQTAPDKQRVYSYVAKRQP